MTRFPRWLCLAIVTALIAAVIPDANARQPAPRLVPIHAAVTTSNGTLVPDLSKEEFDVAIDGNRKTIERFTAPPSPLTLVLLVDMTSSMTFYTDLRDEIGRSFGPALRPGDRARVGAIAGRLLLAPRFSSRVSEIAAAGRAATDVNKDDRAGPSPIWDAVDQTVRALQDEPGVRGLILVTDGKGTGNRISSVTAVEDAVAEGIVVQVLSEARPMVIRQSGEVFARVRSGVMLHELAKRTGGLIVPDDPPATGVLPPAGPIITRLVSELRGMYTLAVAEDGPSGAYHRIAITVKRPGLMVRTRGAYRSR
ncbi:MAG TPA: hypothetical protein VFJ02_09490 [Vicinamibacterales bacterium]|nr:hypothetical protein [Vicinamibacterales bacterium]